MQELQPIWTLLCTGSVIDQESNNISLFELIERLTVHDAKPAEGTKVQVPLHLQLITRIAKQRKEALAFDIRSSFLAPDGSVMSHGAVQSVTFKKDLENIRLRMNMQSLDVDTKQAGNYTFLVEARKKGNEKFTELGRIPLTISFAKKSTKTKK